MADPVRGGNSIRAVESCPPHFRRPKRQRAGALQDAPRSPDARPSRQRLGVRRPSAAFPHPRQPCAMSFPTASSTVWRPFRFMAEQYAGCEILSTAFSPLPENSPAIHGWVKRHLKYRVPAGTKETSAVPDGTWKDYGQRIPAINGWAIVKDSTRTPSW
jgi:hypothetical protein